MYHLDSCVCINLLKGKYPATLNKMRNMHPKNFGISCIAEAELLTGVEKSSHPEKMRYDTERFLSPFQKIPFDSECARHYTSIRAALEKDGRKIGPNDLLIAACALAQGATLITDNVKEFKRVPGLKVECWEECDW